MSYTENPIAQGDKFASIRDKVNKNDTYFKESIDDLCVSRDKSIIFGTYVGNGEAFRNINIGAKPIAVEIYRNDGAQAQMYGNSSGHYGGFAIDGFPCMLNKGDETSMKFKINGSGFTIYNNDHKSGYSTNYIRLNDVNSTYYYKAYMRGQVINS